MFRISLILLCLLNGCTVPDLDKKEVLDQAKKEAIDLSHLKKEFMYGMMWLLVDENNETFTGWVKESYSKNNLKSLGYLKKGQKEGTWLKWHENGSIMSKYRWEQDRLSGPYHKWFRNGQIEATGQTLDGEMNGEWKEFYSNGQIHAITLTDMGRCISKKVWQNDGRKCPVSKLENGNGIYLEYFEDDKAPIKRKFKNGYQIKDSLSEGR